MKPLLIFTLLNLNFCAGAQLLDKSDLLKYKIKSITQKNNLDTTTIYSEYNKLGLKTTEIVTPHFIYPMSEQTTFYSYIQDSLLSMEVTEIRQGTKIVNSDTTYYQYDNFGRLEYVFTPDNEFTSGLLIRYVYMQERPNEMTKKIWQKKTYWTDSSKFDEKNVCDFVFKNGKRYYLRDYEMYSYGSDPNKPTTIYYLEKCESSRDKINQTFCLYQSRQTFRFGDTLTQYLTLNTNISDNTSEQNTFTCDQVRVLVGGPSIDKIEIIKYQNKRIYQSTVAQFGQSPYSSNETYFYNKRGFLIKVMRQMTTKYGSSKETNEVTFIYSYSFY